MSLLDIFKKKEEKKSNIEKKSEAEKKVKKNLHSVSVGKIKTEKNNRQEKKKKIDKKPRKKEDFKMDKSALNRLGATKGKKRQTFKDSYRVLDAPHISEKATNLGEKNKYIFKVKRGTNKIEIKKAINSIYGVEVVDVKIINVKRKKRKLGNRVGWKKGYKKAIVKIKEGQKIDLLLR